MAKQYGGFRFRELKDFNLALLTSMASRVLQEPVALWVRP